MTSLPFTNTHCLPLPRPQHTDQVTSTKRDEVSDKERQRVEKKKYTPWWHGKLGVVLGWALKWSSVAHFHRRGPRVNRSSPRLTKKKRGMKSERVTGCDNKGDHSVVSWWLTGWKPMTCQILLSQMLHPYIKKPLYTCVAAITELWWGTPI